MRSRFCRRLKVNGNTLAGLQVDFLDYLHGGREEAEELGYDSDPEGGDEDDEEEAVSRDDTLSKYSLEQMEKIVRMWDSLLCAMCLLRALPVLQALHLDQQHEGTRLCEPWL